MLSIVRAAKLADLSKATLLRAVKNGKLFAAKADVFHVYPAANDAPEADETAALMAQAEGELAGLESQLEQICARLNGTWDLHDASPGQAQSVQEQLADTRPAHECYGLKRASR